VIDSNLDNGKNTLIGEVALNGSFFGEEERFLTLMSIFVIFFLKVFCSFIAKSYLINKMNFNTLSTKK
jgi:hypothetical protein